MARKLILDTGILIDAERGGTTLGSLIDASDDVAIAAVTVAELRVGIELARTAAVSAKRTQFVLSLLEVVPVEDYGVQVAEAHGRLLAQTHRAGVPRGAIDLIIAATAIATGRTLITADRKAAFPTLPDLSVIEV